MAIEKVERKPPSVAIREEIAKHRNSFMVKGSGFAPLLDMVESYIVATDARISALEECNGKNS